MPFSSLSDPADLARAYAAMESAWNEVAADIPLMHREAERTRLAYVIASCAPLALDEEDLKNNALLQFKERAFTGK